MGIWKKCVLFGIGGGCYVATELLWRGRSHISMFLAGGTCFLLLGKVRKAKCFKSVPVRGIVGAGVITGVELLTGAIWNRSYGVWDYRALPLNFKGQICLPFSLLWVPLSLGAMELYRSLEKSMDKPR